MGLDYSSIITCVSNPGGRITVILKSYELSRHRTAHRVSHLNNKQIHIIKQLPFFRLPEFFLIPILAVLFNVSEFLL